MLVLVTVMLVFIMVLVKESEIPCDIIAFYFRITRIHKLDFRKF